MSDDFRKRMEQSHNKVIEAFERESAWGWHYAERTRQTTKIKEAIEGIDELSHMLCDDGSCGSIFCMTCRKRKQDSLYQQYRDRVALLGDDDTARQRLRYTTILHRLVPVSLDNAIAEHSALDEIEHSVDDFRKQLKGIDRHFRDNDLWARGTIHIELVNMELFRFASLSGNETTKQRTLKELESAQGCSADYYAMVHSHILFDINGLDDNTFRKYLRRKWKDTDRQVDISRLTKYYIDGERFTEHKVDDAIRNIANYGYNGSNGRLSFATNWGSSRKVYTKQEKIDAMGNINSYVEGVKGLDSIGTMMTKGQVRFLIKAHNVFTDNGRGLLVSIL